MKELKYYINDVRLQTDNTDENGVKEREIVRYFNDGIKAIQAIVFKNNPLCSYFQKSQEYPVQSTREFDLPTDCYAFNAVSRVETKGENGKWCQLERVWPEDNFYGWYTANKKLILSGDEGTSYPDTIRVTYFQRLPTFGKRLEYISSVSSGLVQTVNSVEAAVTAYLNTSPSLSIVGPDGVILYDLAQAESVATTNISLHPYFTIPAGTVTTLTAIARKSLVWGKNATFVLDLPDEVEPFLLDYVAKRIYGRNNYGADATKIEYFTETEKGDITSIFADAGQAITRTPITDTDYLRI